MPEITTEPRPDMHELLAAHYPGIFPLTNTGCYACTACTQASEWTAWPCPTVEHAFARAAAA
jgi:hypothetical protein